MWKRVAAAKELHRLFGDGTTRGEPNEEVDRRTAARGSTCVSPWIFTERALSSPNSGDFSQASMVGSSLVVVLFAGGGETNEWDPGCLDWSRLSLCSKKTVGGAARANH